MCGSDEGMLNVACGGKAADGNRDRGSSIGKPRETRLSVFPLSLRLPVLSLYPQAVAKHEQAWTANNTNSSFPTN